MAGLEYGERKCLSCGKTFTALRPWHITCSVECRNARNTKLKQERNKRFTQTAIKLVEMQKKYEAAQNEIASLKAQLEKLARELKNDKEQLFDNATEKEEVKKAIKTAMAKPEMLFCERMNVRALNLPCGKREECFQKPKCKKVPAGWVTPNNL